MSSAKQRNVERKPRRKKGIDLIREDIYFEIEDLPNFPINSLLRKANKRYKDVVPKYENRSKLSPKTINKELVDEEECENARETEEQSMALKRIWKLNPSKNRIDNLLRDFFQTFQDYYWSLFKVLKSWHHHHHLFFANVNCCLNVKTGKKIFNIYRAALKSPPEAPSPEVQLASFKLMSEIADESLLREANLVFRYDSTPEVFVGPVQNLIDKHRYELASQWVEILHLHERLELSTIAFRLLLQNNMRLTTNYLEGMSEISRAKFASVCDRFCQKEELVRFIEQLKIPEVKVEKPRQLAKLVFRLCARFNISTNGLSNLTKWRAIITVDSLVHAQYDRNAIHKDDWEEFLKDTIEDDPQLQLEALQLVVNLFKDSGRAYIWLAKWRVQRSRLPKALLDIIESGKSKPLKRFKKLPNNNLFYQPHLKASHILYIGDANEYKRFIDDLTKLSIVGLDIKGKPNFKSKEIVRTSIMQISTADRVYLLDIISLNSILSRSEWELLHNQLFTNSSISKVVFSFDENWNYIEQICPEAFVNDPSESFIDLKKLSEDKCPDLFISPKILNIWNSDRLEDFSRVVHRYVDLPLDIREEKSNWEKRPLRKAQIQFAAVNAFCLLKVYVEMKLQ